MRIILIVNSVYNEKLNRHELIVSHGVDSLGRNVVLPQESLSEYKGYGANYDRDAGEWYIII